MAERPRLDDLVQATPASRDRTMDFLRAASIVAVVVGHWFIGMIYWRRGVIGTTSAVGVTSGLWLATWFFQVMPIFFFVGGFANATALASFRRRDASMGAFVRSRLERLLRPSLVFLGVWAVAQVVLHLLDIGAPTGPRLWNDTTLLRGMRPPGATVPFGPLWFLAVYLVVVAIAPLTVWLDRRFGDAVPIAMVVGAVLVDIAGFGLQLPPVRWLNVAFVLLFAHQMGHRYADGSFAHSPKQLYWAMVIAGLVGLVLLTNDLIFTPFGDVRFDWFPGIGHYPKSLLGTDVERVSNAYPPTVCFLLGGIWSIGAVMLLRPTLARWLERPGPWKVTIFLNSIIMTLFLWHMTAYLIAILFLWPLGFGHQADSTARWWLERPLWLVVPGIILAALVAIFGRFEAKPRAS
jgi:fucose 4-O-acetylase-like acetyltransferase